MMNDECGMSWVDAPVCNHPLFQTFDPRIKRVVVEDVKHFPHTGGSLQMTDWLKADLALKIEDLTKAINSIGNG